MYFVPLALVISVLLAPDALAQPVASRAVQDAIKNGTVRVMIAFDVPAMRGIGAPQPRSFRAAAAIQSQRDSIQSRFVPGEFVMRRSFSHINALAGEVNEAGLARLLENPAVLRVDLDEGGAGNLNQALPLANVDLAKKLGLSGAGITVAVIDSGYDTNHADLSDDLTAEACFCSGGSGCCPGGGTTQTGAGAAEDDNGHGTNVSGIITSAGNVAPEGGAPDADIVAIKVLDSGNAFCCNSDVVAGLDWIINTRPEVDIVNMSLGTSALFTGDCDNATASTLAYATAIDTLRSSGVPVFVSTGNNGLGTVMQAPACVANSISVGAVYDANVGSVPVLGCTDTTTAADQVTCFTNSNSVTDLMAPGGPTTSSGIGGGLSFFFGTSQASPLAAACAALLLEDDPTLTPGQIEVLLEASPTRVIDATNGLSFPRVDCLAALLAEIVLTILDFPLAGDSSPYIEDGYEMVTTVFGSVRVDSAFADFAVHPSFGFDGDSLLLTKSGGGTFSLVSFDLNDVFTGVLPFEILGTRADSSTVSITVMVDGATGLDTFTPSGFTNLVSLEFGTNNVVGLDNIGLDNVILESVEPGQVAPVPALSRWRRLTLALGLSAAALSVLRRRTLRVVQHLSARNPRP